MFDFLELKPKIFGLSISDSSLKIALIKKKQGLLQPFFLIEKKLPEGLVEKGVIKDEERFSNLLKKLFLDIKEKLKTRYSVVSIPEMISFSHIISMPLMKKEELAFSIPLEAENYIPLSIEEMYLDFELINPFVKNLDHTDIFIGAVEKKWADTYLSCLKNAGIKPIAFELESQALVRFLIKQGGQQQGSLAILDINKDATNFICYSESFIRFTTSISFSLKRMIEVISKELGITIKEAEYMAAKYGLSNIKPLYRSRAVSKVIKSTLEELLLEIKKYLDFYLEHDFHEHFKKSKNKKTIEKVILSGEGVYIKEIDRFLEKRLNLPVEVADPLINFSPKLKKILSSDFQKKCLCFSTALGLALSEKEINFFNYLKE